MTDHSTSNATEKSKAPKVYAEKLCAEPGCRILFQPEHPNQPTCSKVCRDAWAAFKKEERMKRNGSGGGGPDARAKARQQVAFIKEKVEAGVPMPDAFKQLPADLRPTGQAFITHLASSPENKKKAVVAAWKLNRENKKPSTTAIAIEAFGDIEKARSIERWRKADPQFAAALKAAQASYVHQIDETMHLTGVKGLKKAIVSMGQVVDYETVIDSKVTLALKRQYDPDFAKANSSGGGVNIQVNTGLQQGPEDLEPTMRVTLSEAFALPERDREELARIYQSVLVRRAASAGEKAPLIDLTPPQEVLDLQAEERAMAEDATFTEEDISDDI